METIVVGDLHGQYEIVDQVLDTGMPVVFIGDYLDSFTRDSVECVTTLTTVLDAIEDREDVQGILGNHEMSYLDEYMRCSGYNRNTQEHILNIKDRMLSLLKPYVRSEGFLISHAGVSNVLLAGMECTLEEYLEKEEFYQIGFRRGGRDPCGGLYWCDWNSEFKPIHDTPQIVGHTRGDGVRQKGNSFCIDCLEDKDKSVVIIDDRSIKAVPLDELSERAAKPS